MHHRASVKGILCLAGGLQRVAMKTGTITRHSAFISGPLHCVTWLYGLFNIAKPGYGGIIAQSGLNLSIMECCSRKDVTQSDKWWRIPRHTVWSISSRIIVVGEMNFVIQLISCEVPTARSPRYCLASRLSLISNNSSFRRKHPGVTDGSDGSDGTSCPLTEIHTLLVAQAMGRVALHQQNVCLSLEASRSVWEDVECKLRCFNNRSIRP